MEGKTQIPFKGFKIKNGGIVMSDNIFSFAEEQKNEQIALDNIQQYPSKIDVVKMEFLEADTISWHDLFAGYEKLYAITYSSGIGFVCELIKMFTYSELIFGSDEVLSYNMQEIMAYQLKTIERIRTNMTKTKIDLISKIDEGSLKMYIARKKMSHEKIYLLEAKDGRKRTIFGSANMSQAAFTGFQRENICYIDGDKAFDWYMDSFERFKLDCSDNITVAALSTADDNENIEEIPVLKTVKVKKALIIEPQNELKEEVRFVLDVRNLANKFSPYIPKAEKNGKTVLSPEKIITTRKRIVAAKIQEKELRSEYPQLVVNVDEGTALLNDTILDLSPDQENIKNDVELFIQYMSGYERFHGDVRGMQSRYFEFANWFFASPFMASMRNMAIKYNQNLLPYPVFGLLYGQSKAGKTSFLETLLKMMIGQKTKISAPDFTRSTIESLKKSVMGAPIVVDDLTQARFNQHAIETIKNDDFGVSDGLLFYPAVVISANEDVKAVAPEVIRRTVICRVQAGLTNTELMKNNIVRRVQKNIGTAFYREYLRNMLEEIPEHIEALKDDETVGAPDILATSSKVICRIIKEHYEGEIPFYIRELTLDDYFSEKVTGAYAMKTIQNAWAVNKKSFVVNKKLNQLRYNAGQTWEADRIIKELPEDLEAHKVRECIVMELDKACEFFGIDFKKQGFLNLFMK